MADEIKKGITLSFNGDTSNFDKSVDKVNQSLKKEKTILKEINSELKLDPKNVDLLNAKLGSLGKQEELLKEKIIAYNKELDNISDADIGGKQWEAIQKNLTSANYELAKVRKNIDDTNSSLNGGGFGKLGDDIKGASDKASTFGDVLKANITSEAIIGGVKLLANAFKEVGSAMLDIVKDSANYADEINTLSKQYNLSTKELQQYTKASALIDVEVNTIAKSMSKLTKNMNNPSTSVSEAFKKLGVSVRDSKGELRDSNQVFNEVISKLGEVANETEQDALALEIFGKSSAELGSLINGGAEQLAEFNKYLEENNLLLSQDELDSLNGIQDGFDTMKATIDSIKQKIAVELAPVLEPIVEGINQFILDNKDKIIEIIDKIVEWINSEEGQAFFEDVKEMGANIGQMIEDIIEIGKETGIWKGALDLVKFVVEAISELVRGIKLMIEDIIKMTDGDYNWLEAKDTMGNPYRRMGYHDSGGFGALQSGGYGNNISLKVNFNVAGQLDEQKAIMLADIMSDRINENLGNQMG